MNLAGDDNLNLIFRSWSMSFWGTQHDKAAVLHDLVTYYYFP